MVGVVGSGIAVAAAAAARVHPEEGCYSAERAVGGSCRFAGPSVCSRSSEEDTVAVEL